MLIFYMKKIVFLLFFISLGRLASLIPVVSSEETHYLKLRANRHPEFLRIVLEGTESVISKGLVTQQGKDILVRFPYLRFTIQEEKPFVNYKTDKDTILFSPKNFSKFKTFSLKYPSRLVIDVYTETSSAQVLDTDVLREPQKKDADSSVKSGHQVKTSQIQKIKTVIIDPGHGGYESGITAGGYKEKNVVLDIAKRLKALINRDSTRCLLTRESDQSMSLSERVKFANNREVEIFLSLHIGRHSGIVLYTPVITEPVTSYIRTFMINKGQEGFMTKTTALGNALQRAIKEDFGDDMVLVKPLPYSILSKIEAAALIIELPSFEDADYTAERKTELANTIYKGIYLYEEDTAAD
jgi:hypothetical protein